MTDQFTIQCQSCGTLYNDLQDVCPYCGETQPIATEKTVHLVDEYETDEAYLNQPDDLQQQSLHEDEYFADDEELSTAPAPFADDDIFAIAGEDDPDDEYDDDGFYDEKPDDELADTYDDDSLYYDEHADLYHDEHQEAVDFAEEELPLAPARRFTFRRLFTGCLGLVLCGLLFYGGVGVLAVRQGLQERNQNNLVEAQEHYQKGQAYLANNSIELAMAEFERAIMLNPNLTEAIQGLRQAQRIAQTQPTPTSETRSAAVAEFLGQAETQINAKRWLEALETLLQVRGLDPEYETERVSELLYTASYQQGLKFIISQQATEALAAFEQALAERPNDPDVLEAQNKVSLYIEGTAAKADDAALAVDIFNRLYELDTSYLDTAQQLAVVSEIYGDELAAAEDWCVAEGQYSQANRLDFSDTLEIKAKNAAQKCTNSGAPATATPSPTKTPTRIAKTPTRTASESELEATSVETDTTTVSLPANGSILFSAFNPNESRWEIVSVPVSGGEPKVLVTDATMPAVSPNRQLLLYHAELKDTEGLHIFNLITGEDQRITQQSAHILPRWGGDNSQFIFTAQEAGTGRWLVYQGFADGKGNPVTLRDGRTPDWSANNSTIAYQGTDAEGNNPGIYIVPFAGGESTRLTEHESDRSPAFAPNSSQVVYMSTQNENWDIYTINTTSNSPVQLTTSPGNDGLPTWSPDGSKIAYVSDADGSWAIYVVEASGGAPFKITEWDGHNRADWLIGQLWWMR